MSIPKTKYWIGAPLSPDFEIASLSIKLRNFWVELEESSHWMVLEIVNHGVWGSGRCFGLVHEGSYALIH